MNKAETVTIIRSILSANSEPCSVPTLNSEFKKLTGINVPLFGYEKLNDFLQSLSDTVKVTGLYPFQKISLVENEKSSHIVSLVSRQKSNNPIKGIFPIKVKPESSIIKPQQKVINSYEATKKFPQTPVFNVHKKGFTDKSEFDEFVKKLPITPPVPKKDPISDSGGNLECSLPAPQSNFPLFSYMVVNESLPAINVRDHAKPYQYVEVRPCFIRNPHFFYFHFRKFKNVFEAFQNELNKFYSRKKDRIPILPNKLVEPGQLCVVSYQINNKTLWNRAEIVSVTQKSLVVVFLFDYGCTAVIQKCDIKMFHKSFLAIPKQAVRGYLANIKPLNGDSKWSPKATMRFTYFSLENDLIGGVVKIDTSVDKDDVRVGLALTETKGTEIHINDTLVEEGYAEFDLFEKKDTSLDYYDVLLKETSSAVGFIENINNNNMELIQKGKCRKILPDNTSLFYSRSCWKKNTRLKKLFSVA